MRFKGWATFWSGLVLERCQALSQCSDTILSMCGVRIGVSWFWVVVKGKDLWKKFSHSSLWIFSHHARVLLKDRIGRVDWRQSTAGEWGACVLVGGKMGDELVSVWEDNEVCCVWEGKLDSSIQLPTRSGAPFPIYACPSPTKLTMNWCWLGLILRGWWCGSSSSKEPILVMFTTSSKGNLMNQTNMLKIQTNSQKVTEHAQNGKTKVDLI